MLKVPLTGWTMLTIGDLMTRDVVSVEPNVDLRTLVNVLVERHVSGVPVVKGRRAIGVISASDVLDLLARTPGVPSAQTDFVEQGEVAAPGEWEEGADALQEYFTTLWNEGGADVAERFERIEAPEWDLLSEYTVGEVMTRTIAALPPETPIATAARFLIARNIHRVLVVDGEGLLGVLTVTDLVRAIADGRLVPRRNG